MAATGSTAAVIGAVHGRIDPGLLFDPVLRPEEDTAARQLTFEDLLREADGDHADHLHAAYESVSFTSDVPMDPRRFMAFLDSRPPGLYRIKGFADFGAGDRANAYALHAVGGFLRFVPRPWAAGEARRTQLVLIGSGIDTDALSKELDGCRTTPAQAATDGSQDLREERQGPGEAGQDAADELERSMWGVLRYVRQPDED